MTWTLRFEPGAWMFGAMLHDGWLYLAVPMIVLRLRRAQEGR